MTAFYKRIYCWRILAWKKLNNIAHFIFDTLKWIKKNKEEKLIEQPLHKRGEMDWNYLVSDSKVTYRRNKLELEVADILCTSSFRQDFIFSLHDWEYNSYHPGLPENKIFKENILTKKQHQIHQIQGNTA